MHDSARRIDAPWQMLCASKVPAVTCRPENCAASRQPCFLDRLPPRRALRHLLGMLSHVAKPAEHAPEPGASLVPHLAAVRRYLRFLGAERADLDDLVQEVLLAAVRSFAAVEPTLPWLLVTARNALRQHLRRLGRRHEVADLDRLDAAWATQMGDDAGQSKREALVLCLQSLPERSRRAVLLRYQEGLSREAIAAQTGLGVEGVKSLLERVRAALAGCIERRVRHE